MNNTKIIVLEGLDCGGKDTLQYELSVYFHKNGIKYNTLNSLSSDDLSPIIRRKLKDKNVTRKELCGLYIAELHSHLKFIENTIKTESPEYFIINRWIFSTAAYNSDIESDIEHILKLSAYLYIDHILYLDIKPEDAIKRLENRKELDTFETLEELNRVYENYNKISNMYKFEYINAMLSKEDVLSQALKLIK